MFVVNVLTDLDFVGTGMVYPAFGIIYAHALSDFATTDRHALRFRDNRLLWRRECLQ